MGWSIINVTEAETSDKICPVSVYSVLDMDAVLGAALIRLVIIAVLVLITGISVMYRHRHLFGLFNRKHSYYVDVGPLTFRLNYIKSLRNPSGRMIFTWTDELGRIHEQTDPRVFVIETTGSAFSRQLRGAPDLTSEDYTNAVKKHISHGKGWCSVSNTEVMRDSLFRWIAFCVVHVQIKPAPSSEAITD
jgi:hypothetical protein